MSKRKERRKEGEKPGRKSYATPKSNVREPTRFPEIAFHHSTARLTNVFVGAIYA